MQVSDTNGVSLKIKFKLSVKYKVFHVTANFTEEIFALNFPIIAV